MVKVIHRECGKIAFYLKRKWKAGDRVNSENVINLDGETPQPHTYITCGSCGSYMRPAISDMEQLSWKDWFIQKIDGKVTGELD